MSINLAESRGLKKFPDAPALDRARAYLYRAELAARLENVELAQTSLAAVAALDLSELERESLAEELARTVELVQETAVSKSETTERIARNG